MKLTPASTEHIRKLMSWFPNEHSLSLWSGPGFRYPFNEQSFKEDLKVSALSSFALIDSENNFLAFGQFYLRANRCHLGRLVVNPDERGKGIAEILLQALSHLGCKTLAVNEVSLFVLKNNATAEKAYIKHGFQFTPYPGDMPLENCRYMIKKQP